SSPKGTTKRRKTGKSGKASAFGRTSRGVYLSAQKTGFYSTHNSYEFTWVFWRRREPWNPTVDLPLRRIGNPVPMYAREFFNTILPEATLTEGGVGYDLLVGDWVEPHGKGTVKDMVFSLKRNYVESRDFEAELRITMPNPGDGFSPISPEEILEGSELPLPPTAHEEGYVPSLVLVQEIQPRVRPMTNTVEPKANSFFLRVRTQLGPDGKVESAMYGKLVGPFSWYVHGTTTAVIDTTYYYVNPDGTRNVEFDPKRNLLQGLRSSERPDKP
ncbi:MAG: hypothetical protein RBU25_19310, partial [Lentisphaeria bacterium]|nr:hypothetical protein [Lentisphaeria bacterium]